MDKAVKEVNFYGPIRALLSDNGSKFSSHWKHKKEGSTGIFQKHLEQNGIKHITTSVNHPQTNGKLEKCFENAETPSEAFTREMIPEDVFQAMINLFGR